MGIQENIHAAQTIAISIGNHVGNIRKCATSIDDKTDIIKKVVSGTRSGDQAIIQMDNAGSVLTDAANELETVAGDLRAYANKIASS